MLMLGIFVAKIVAATTGLRSSNLSLDGRASPTQSAHAGNQMDQDIGSLTYKGHIILLNACLIAGARLLHSGFKAADIKKADVILIGHAHFDHMSDAASVSASTGAIVVGAPVTYRR